MRKAIDEESAALARLSDALGGDDMATRHGDGIGSMPCGRAATSDGALDDKTKDLIALALSVAARCDPCIGFHTQTMVQLEATSQELDETLGSPRTWAAAKSA